MGLLVEPSLVSVSTSSLSRVSADLRPAQGAVGGTAQSIGGPLDKEGAIGKHFNADGAIGGTFQELAKKNEQH